MKTLFRNPFFILLRYVGGLALIAPALAWALGGVNALEIALQILLTVGAAMVGLTLAALQRGWLSSYRIWRKRKIEAQRFLCPTCLQLEPFTYACGQCEEELELFQVHTAGAFYDQCQHCQYEFFGASLITDHIKAYCKNCFATHDRGIYHERKVCVQATVLAANFVTLRATSGAPLETGKNHTQYFCVDDGQTFWYVLNGDPSPLSNEAPHAHHALSHLDVIWLDVEGQETLQIARAIDAMVRHLQLSDKQRQYITMCVRQDSVEPALKTRLETQFGLVKYGVAASLGWPEQAALEADTQTIINEELPPKSQERKLV